MKNNIRKLAYLVLAGMMVICVYLAFIPYYIDQVAGSGRAPEDPRIAIRENQIKRGDILDRQEAVLARSVISADGSYTREYPYGSTAAHVVGYNSPRYGSAGVEKSMAEILLGLKGQNEFTDLRDYIFNLPGVGNDLILTIDIRLQQEAYSLLAGRKGAIVALEPSTGAVLAMASYPHFDPENIEEYLNASDSPLLNRAAQGAYPPGSAFKIVTGAALRSNLPDLTNEHINCTGELKIDGFTLRDNGVHGDVYFQDAFAMSCNVAFAEYGIALGAKNLVKQAESFGVGQSFEFELPVYKGQTGETSMDRVELASSAIGQGDVLISPLQAAMLAGGVANEGVVMKPYLTAGYKGPNGIQSVTAPKELLQAMDPLVAAAVTEDMIVVIEQGTGKRAAIAGVSVAGKTGSAENPHGATHAWFVGFAPADSPRVAVAVLLENAGSGGVEAAPLAGEFLWQALNILGE